MQVFLFSWRVNVFKYAQTSCEIKMFTLYDIWPIHVKWRSSAPHMYRLRLHLHLPQSLRQGQCFALHLTVPTRCA